MKPCLPVHALAVLLGLVLLGFVSVARAADSDAAALRGQAENGNAIAQYNLGLMYAEGRAVPRDVIEAYVWLSLATENGATGRALGVLIGTMTADLLELADWLHEQAEAYVVALKNVLEEEE